MSAGQIDVHAHYPSKERYGSSGHASWSQSLALIFCNRIDVTPILQLFLQARGHDEQLTHMRQGSVPLQPWRTMHRQTGAMQIYAAVAASAAQAPNAVQIFATILVRPSAIARNDVKELQAPGMCHCTHALG